MDLVIAEARQDDKRRCGSEHDCRSRRRLALQPPWPVLWLGGHAAALLEPRPERLELLNPGSHAAGLGCSGSLADGGEASGAEQQRLTAAGGRQTQRERGQQEVLHVLGLWGVQRIGGSAHFSTALATATSAKLGTPGGRK